MRCPRRVGQPYGQVGWAHAAQDVAAPPAAIQVGQPWLDRRPQAQQLGGLARWSPGSTRFVAGFASTASDSEIDRRVDLPTAGRVEWFIGGKPSAHHRIGRHATRTSAGRPRSRSSLAPPLYGLGPAAAAAVAAGGPPRRNRAGGGVARRVGDRHGLYGRTVGADLRPHVADFGGVEPHRDDRVGAAGARLVDQPLIALLRLSVRFLVMPCSSPPNIDLNPAPIWAKRFATGR